MLQAATKDGMFAHLNRRNNESEQGHLFCEGANKRAGLCFHSLVDKGSCDLFYTFTPTALLRKIPLFESWCSFERFLPQLRHSNFGVPVIPLKVSQAWLDSTKPKLLCRTDAEQQCLFAWALGKYKAKFIPRRHMQTYVKRK